VEELGLSRLFDFGATVPGDCSAAAGIHSDYFLERCDPLESEGNVDWGESHYIGRRHVESGIPIGAEKWIDGFDHDPWREICRYFIRAYKNGGQYPEISVFLHWMTSLY